MSTGSIDLYVYYQVADADAPTLRARVGAMQAGLGRGQLKRRPGSSDGRQTWMEVYPAVAPAFLDELAAAVAAAALAAAGIGDRHTEIFTDLAPMEAAPCA
ncbi:DUF4936 family protein [Massilia sp. DWR3-1-1]|uniref:DUF4936 family protein n=1 Tax=Massilia sp. DWR3-1-1 TaxID=2804559 RepID=UPI003CF4567C